MKEWHVYDGDDYIGSVFAKTRPGAVREALVLYENTNWTAIIDPSVSEYD